MTNKVHSNIVNECLVAATDEFLANKNEKLEFHNFDHTINVFNTVTELAERTAEISDREMELLQIAALFHDIYACRSKNHEADSADFARKLLIDKKVNKEDIGIVERLILVTKLGHQPGDILEQLIKDADIAHIGTKSYISSEFINLFNEINHFKEKTPNEWINDCIIFFDKRPFYSGAAKAIYSEQKEKNKEKLIELSKMEINSEKELVKKTAKKKKKKAAVAKEKSEKGVETLFRVNLRNHLTLSMIADEKANTLISVNGIIISIVLSALFPKLDNNQYLMWPALTLVSFSIITIIISIVSTIPRTTHGLMTREDIENKKGNLTFFGNFHRMKLDDFEWGMGELMKDKDYLYKSMSRDLYYLGLVLNKKYTFLRWGYIIFVSGLLLSCMFFVFGVSSNYEQFAG